VHLAKLRKKVDHDGEALLETVRGEGYRYVGPGTDEPVS
jgi:DNA-binding response OmpR family regulator